MPSFKGAYAQLPASDFERAKSWWADRIGLKPARDYEGGADYEVGGTRFSIYPSQFAGKNEGTAMALEVDDVPATVKELRGNGVEFLDYDLPGLKTDEGILTSEEGGQSFQIAWFKDSEGNIVAVANSPS